MFEESGKKIGDINISWDSYPERILEKIRHLPYNNSADTNDYKLKICGTNEYLLTRRPITQYKVSFHNIYKNIIYIIKLNETY